MDVHYRNSRIIWPKEDKEQIDWVLDIPPHPTFNNRQSSKTKDRAKGPARTVWRDSLFSELYGCYKIHSESNRVSNFKGER